MTLFGQPEPDSAPMRQAATPQVDPLKSYCQRLSAVLNLSLESDRRVLQAMHSYRRAWPEKFRETAWVDLSFLIDLPLHLGDDTVGSGGNSSSGGGGRKRKCHLHFPSPLRSVKRTCSAKRHQAASQAAEPPPPVVVDRRVSRLMAHLLENDRYKTEGIFRKTGNCSRQKELRRQLLQCPECSLAGYTVHDVASVLKLLLRSLEEPIVSDRMFELLAAIAELSSADKVLGRTEAERALVRSRQLHALRIFGQLLPESAATLLSSLLHLLHSVASCPETRMSCDSLGTVFGPVLFCAKSAEAVSSLQKLERLNRMSAFLIGNCYQLSAIPRSFAEKLASQWSSVQQHPSAISPTTAAAAAAAPYSVRFSSTAAVVVAPNTAPVTRCHHIGNDGNSSSSNSQYQQQRQRLRQHQHQQLACLQKRLRLREDCREAEAGCGPLVEAATALMTPSSYSAAVSRTCQQPRHRHDDNNHHHRPRLVRRALSSLRLNRRLPPPPQPQQPPMPLLPDAAATEALRLRLRFDDEASTEEADSHELQLHHQCQQLRPLSDRRPTPLPARKRVQQPANSVELPHRSPELRQRRHLRSSTSLTFSTSSTSASSLASRLSSGSACSAAEVVVGHCGKPRFLETAL